MDKYLSMVMDYINRPDTNYALLISGDWGNGKTHFIDKVVLPKLMEEGKKPIYISLNGISSTEEISKEIYLKTSLLRDKGVQKFTESKPAKYAAQLIKAASAFYGTGISETTINFEELIDLKNNIVLCFDDLERCQINIIELLGYLNNFVEHDEVKTIIVGNEKEIKDISSEQNKELKMLTAIASLGLNKGVNNEEINKTLKNLFSEQKTYDVIKEKIIGKTIVYSPDSMTVVQEIIRDYEESNPNYFQFLNEFTEDILYIFDKSSRRNIRVLKHSLSDFTNVYEILDTLADSSYKKQLLIRYFVPSLIFGIEFKSGKITEDQIKNVTTATLTRAALNTSLVQIPPFGYREYLQDYIKHDEFYSSKSIITYISSSILNEAELLAEARNFISEMSKKEAETKAEIPKTSVQKLIGDFLELENEEFNHCIQDVLSEVKEGVYPLEFISKIFYQFEVFVNHALIDKNIEEVKQIFIEGIKISNPKQTEDDRLEMLYVETKSDHLKEIEDIINYRFIHVRSQRLKKDMDIILGLLPENVDDFTDQYYQLAKGRDNYNAVMPLINIPEFFSKLTGLTNADLHKVRVLFNSIYSFSNIRDYYKDDYQPMLQLIRLIRNHQHYKVDGIKSFTFKLLANDLIERARLLNK
ncbi:KAP family NTPase [Domibacillus sp. PGB-M46]|uniref:P-loop NTPase fold protein n=1 Tax=Domibacillus sp. PGB-M46 TaxID=2910255 RepID=UPI001F5AD996|nr:P-loop NTPase fold protein [Domibacillus sp. PGB-M46]MCI2254556.1 KAP family NTPase [Domibacillus sp. PGB-M46]